MGPTHGGPTRWWPHTQWTNTMVATHTGDQHDGGHTHRGPTRWWLHTGNPNTTRWWPHKVTLLLWHYDGSVMNSCQRRWSVTWKIACSRPAVVERYIMRDASSCPCGALTAVYVSELVEANTRGTNTMVATPTADQHDGGHTHGGPTRWWPHTGNPNTTRWRPHTGNLNTVAL